jgi:hypothetical protein
LNKYCSNTRISYVTQARSFARKATELVCGVTRFCNCSGGCVYRCSGANWNETQKRRTLYHDAYQRVHQEVSNNIKSIRAVQNYYRKRPPAVQRVIETLRTCGADGGSIENIEATFPVVMNYSQILLSVRDIELMLSNNSFLAFQHTELRT